ncbi:GM22619 [Drosophila sechellia]|uniref:GM22619 n=1 Tax=Drosophila sechellia TaxID=7238 RepID=B4I6I3_DROSE|nr:GM22619 [Drosophila sechellia]
MMVPEGGSAKLVCRARGSSEAEDHVATRRWAGEIIARNGSHQKTKAQSVEGEMLTLSKITRSEMGAYMCIASNGVPPTVSKRMKLQVHCEYHYTIYIYPYMIHDKWVAPPAAVGQENGLIYGSRRQLMPHNNHNGNI